MYQNSNTMNLFQKTFIISLFLIFASTFISTSQATLIKPATIEDDAKDASYIFNGTVTDVQTVQDTEESGFLVSYFTFQINECLKGDCGKSYVLKQITTLPPFKKGQSYLLFLTEPHEETGLSAPLGIYTGRYELKKVGGKWQIPNLQKNQNYQKSFDKPLSSGQRTLSDGQVIPQDYQSFTTYIKKESEK